MLTDTHVAKWLANLAAHFATFIDFVVSCLAVLNMKIKNQ